MKLRAKISMAMVFLAILATLIAVFLAGKSIRNSFNYYVDKNFSYRLERMQDSISVYYSENGGWEGIQSVFNSYQLKGQGMGPYGRGQGASGIGHGMMGPNAGLMMGPGKGEVLLADQKGKIIAATNSQYLGNSAPEGSIKQGLPVKVNGTTVGTLFAVNTNLGQWEYEFIDSITNTTIWAVAVASIIALILSIFISSHLTGPLAVLTAAARRFADRDLSFRVPVTARDEIGELAESFNHMAESLERNEKLRRTLIADTAHELRTPLAVLRGNLESLQEGVITSTPEIIISLHDEVVRISRLVNELQDMSMADAGELRLKRSEVSVEELVEKIEIPFSGEAKYKNINFIVNIPFPDLPTVYADMDRIVQVLLNVLGNALRYTLPGGTVSLSAGMKDDSNVVFIIKDNGIGIPDEDLTNIFERFYRSDQSRSRSGGGTGLGLAIAKGIIEAHDGRIWAESKLNEGSTFFFTLPVFKK